MTETILLLPLLLLLLRSCGGEEQPAASIREYYIAAVEIGWDYTHQDGVLNLSGTSKGSPQKHIKAVYREYTDATFSVPRPRPAWTGIQGPVIVAQAGDRVVVHFKNLASQSYSISPVGITYWKQSEGAGYEDSTAGQEKDDDAVAPGAYFEYIWDISPKDGPTASDPDCLTYSYSSQVHTVRDMNSGLIGALLICKSSAFMEDGQRRNSAFVLLFAVFDESKSWYGQLVERTSKTRDGRKEYHTINGYVNSTLPGLTVCQGHYPVSWHIIGMGSTPEIHSIRFQDHSLQVLNHRKVTVEVTPMTFVSAEMRPTTAGRFLISCQIHAHQYDGMNALLSVEKCPEPAVRKVKHDNDIDTNLEDDGDDFEYMFNTVHLLPKNPGARGRSTGRQVSEINMYFIAAEEVMWDYVPHLNPTESKLNSRYLPSFPHHLDYKYKKVVYVEYEDASFTKKKIPSTNLLGPILKGKVNDQLHIIFKNLASRSFNIYPSGLTGIYPLHRFGIAAENDLRSMGIPPNGTYGYIWSLTADDGPLAADPQCLTQLYQSTISPEQDLASGLVGTLLICRYDALDTKGTLLAPDEKLSLIFSVFDENRSWYFKENMQRSSQNKSSSTEMSFYESNIIYSINGIMFGARQFVMCQTDVSFWYVANVGTQSEFLSVYFTGNPFQYEGLYQSVLTLFPMTAVTVPMEAELLGEWEISAFDNSLRERGMSIRYTVRPCTEGELPLVDRDINEDISEYFDEIFPQPRGSRPQNGTVLVRVCKKPITNDTLSRNGTLSKTGRRECQLKRVPVSLLEKKKATQDPGVPEDILRMIDSEGSWSAPQNSTEATGKGTGRKRREADDSNDIWPVNKELFHAESASTEESEVPNYVLTELEMFSDDLFDPSYNFTDENTTMADVSFTQYDYPFEGNGSLDVFGSEFINPRSGESRPRHYYIAAEEITWDYGLKTSHLFNRPKEIPQGKRKFLPEYKKVVFRAYLDKDFKYPVHRGELQHHLGLMGPFIRAEVNDLLTVVFRNNAKRHFSFHLHGVYDRTQGAGVPQTSSPCASPGSPGDPVPPGECRTYNWKISKKQGPTDPEFDCKTGAYYSTVDREKDLHSGLIGPLVICKPNTLQMCHNTKPKVQEFALLFHTFDETKSWYLEENLQKYCTPPCQADPKDPWYYTNNKFAAINGYVAETLPGLTVVQHQPVRWHLLNVGSDREYHAVHFHGLPFTVHAKQMHRMGVYKLFPGIFGTVEMNPPTVGTWLVECTIGDYQLAGMRAKLLVYSPKCVLPLGMKSERIKDSQITASDHIDNWQPRLARLDQSGYINAWMGKGEKSWLQVDLLKPTLLHGIQTQGVSSKLRDHTITHFAITYSLDQETWTTYKANNCTNTMLFHGTLKSSTVKHNSFSPPFVARYIRIKPVRFLLKPALRLELLGCDLNSCSSPLGLQSGWIPDTSFTASSHHSSMLRSWKPNLARLHQTGGANAWRPKSNNAHEWLQVDLGKIRRITGVITQGAHSLLTQMMVTEFAVTYSQDKHSWSSVLEESSQRERIFVGNNDPDEEAINMFDRPLFGRFLRIHPRGWMNDIALRLEVLGCDTLQWA